MGTKEEYEVGKFYWVWIALDPDAKNDWENEIMPARFSGYSEDGNELWNFIDAEPSEWPVRLAYDINLVVPSKESIVRKVYNAAKSMHHHYTDEECMLGATVDSALIQMCELGYGSRQQSISDMTEMHMMAGKMEKEIHDAAISAVLDRLEVLINEGEA